MRHPDISDFYNSTYSSFRRFLNSTNLRDMMSEKALFKFMDKTFVAIKPMLFTLEAIHSKATLSVIKHIVPGTDEYLILEKKWKKFKTSDELLLFFTTYSMYGGDCSDIHRISHIGIHPIVGYEFYSKPEDLTYELVYY